MKDQSVNPTDHAARLDHLLAAAVAGNGGSRDWRRWKEAEAASVLELAAKASRMEILALDMSGDLDVEYGIRMPVPRWPQNGQLVVGNFAVFHLHYQESWRTEPPPGWAPLGLIHPLDPFHPNMRPALRGAICLGKLPAGVPAKELVLLGYYALCLQDLVLDETDPNGVLNPLACEFFRNQPVYPLTRAGLMDPLESEVQHA